MPPTIVPILTTDAEAFLDQYLSDLDFTQFKPLTWEAEKTTPCVNMHLVNSSVRCNTAERGIP